MRKPLNPAETTEKTDLSSPSLSAALLPTYASTIAASPASSAAETDATHRRFKFPILVAIQEGIQLSTENGQTILRATITGDANTKKNELLSSLKDPVTNYSDLRMPYAISRIKTHTGDNIECRLSNNAGEERFHSISNKLLREANCIFILGDTSSVMSWQRQCEENCSRAVTYYILHYTDSGEVELKPFRDPDSTFHTALFSQRDIPAAQQRELGKKMLSAVAARFRQPAFIPTAAAALPATTSPAAASGSRSGSAAPAWSLSRAASSLWNSLFPRAAAAPEASTSTGAPAPRPGR